MWYKRTHIHTCMHVHACARTQTHRHTDTHTHACMHTCMHAHRCAYSHIYITMPIKHQKQQSHRHNNQLNIVCIPVWVQSAKILESQLHIVADLQVGYLWSTTISNCICFAYRMHILIKLIRYTYSGV